MCQIRGLLQKGTVEMLSRHDYDVTSILKVG